MKITCWPILLAVLIFAFSCKRSSPVEEQIEDARKSLSCGTAVAVNASNFGTATSNAFMLADASISGDCLTVKIGSSGCSGSTWQANVLHAVSDAAVYPQEHLLKVVFTNRELCAAAFGKTFEFDLYPLRQKGTNKILLSISGSEGYYKTLAYTY